MNTSFKPMKSSEMNYVIKNLCHDRKCRVYKKIVDVHSKNRENIAINIIACGKINKH